VTAGNGGRRADPVARPPLRHPAVWLSTLFGAGFLKPAPGTLGSLLAVGPGWLLLELAGPVALAAAALLVFGLGCWSAGRYVRLTGRQDPSEVVIDEVAGQWLTLACVPADPLWIGAAFLLFRVMDITKPWPVRLADRRVHGGFGIMLDDLLAAGYAGGLLLAAQMVLGPGPIKMFALG